MRVMILVSSLLSVGIAASEQPILETYSFAVGGDGKRVDASLLDRAFGGGTARARVWFAGKEAEGELRLRIWRTVRPGEIVFALLCFGVQTRCYDAEGKEIFRDETDGFTFGDSAPGEYKVRFEDLPANLARVQVRFIGNYE